VSARSWVSVASSDDDDELLPSIESTSLDKRSVDFLIAWEEDQALGFGVSRLECQNRPLWAWNLRCGLCTQECGCESMRLIGHVMDANDRGC